MVITESFIDPDVQEPDSADSICVHIEGNEYLLEVRSSLPAPGPLVRLRLSLSEAAALARDLPRVELLQRANEGEAL